jgi:1-acyl-sn-glycerol-3-phosphate acyltransferase
MSHIRAGIKALLLALLAVLALCVLGVMQALRLHRLQSTLRVCVYRLTLRILGIRVTVHGTFAPSPVFLVSNHCSYLDVMIMGSIRDICFTPKSDVRTWPFIGLLITLFGVIFVSRNPKDAKEVQHAILTGLHSQRPLSLFPEGTTNNGRELLAFKPSMFQLVHLWNGSQTLAIQPASLRYDRLDGKPMHDTDFDKVAWYGDMDFFPHLWQFLHCSSLHAEFTLHPPLDYDTTTHRKTLAQHAQDIVRLGLKLDTPSQPSHNDETSHEPTQH